MGKRVKGGLLGFVFLGVAAVGGIFALKFALFAVSAAGSRSADSIILEVHKGQSPNELTHLLITQGVVADGRSFIWLGRLTRQWKKIKAGEYKLAGAMSPLEIFATITSGVSVPHPITVREGENMYEVAADVEAKGLGTKVQL